MKPTKLACELRSPWLALTLSLLPLAVWAQSVPVYQMGTTVPNNLAKYQGNGEIRDAVGVDGDNNGMGVTPFAATDFKQRGICSNSASTNGPYSQICIGHDTDGSGIVTLDSLAGEPARSLKLVIDGVTTSLPQPIPAPAPTIAVTCTGTGTGDSALIQTAIGQVATAGGGTLLINAGTPCAITTTLLISTSQIGIACGGYGKGVVDNYVLETGLPKCTLQWTGASGGTILKISAPLGTTSSLSLYGNFVRGVNFNGNNGLAANGLVIESVMQGMFQGNHFAQFDGGYALDLNVVHATATNFNPNFCSQFNLFMNNTIDQHFHTSVGLRLGMWVDPALPGRGCNASVNTFINTMVSSTNHTAILLDGADNNRFINTSAITDTGGGAASVDFSIATRAGSAYPSNSNMFWGLSTPSSGGKIIARGRESFPTCVVYAGTLPPVGVLADACTYGNTVDGLDAGNGAGNFWPLQETGAGFAYRWTDENYLHTATLPTVVGCSGLSTGAVCALETESKNEVGWINMRAAAGAVATGAIELKLNGYMGKKLMCTTQLMVTPTAPVGTWAGTAQTTLDVYPTSTTPAYAYYTMVINWINGGVPLVAGNWYRLGYACRGFNYF